MSVKQLFGACVQLNVILFVSRTSLFGVYLFLIVSVRWHVAQRKRI